MSQDLVDLTTEFSTTAIDSARRIGSGGFGDVFVVNHRDLGRVALKSFRETGNTQLVSEKRRRARREAQTWHRCQHAHILPILGIIDSEKHFFLVSPFAENGSLDVFVLDHPDVDRISLLAEVASGLAYLHQEGIVHGDVKAANVLISADAHALLCDFGLTKLVDSATSTEVKGVGSLRWMGPELLTGDGRKTPASDSWAFGMTIYEVISGAIPFDSAVEYAVVFRMIAFEHRLPPQEPAYGEDGRSYKNAWKVATECWHKKPHKRIALQEARNVLLSPPPARLPISTPWRSKARRLARSASETITRPLMSISGSIKDLTRTVRTTRSEGDATATTSGTRTATILTNTAFIQEPAGDTLRAFKADLYCTEAFPTRAHFGHALARALRRGAAGRRPLPTSVVTEIMQFCHFPGSSWTMWQHAEIQHTLVARDQRIVRHRLFVSEAVTSSWIEAHESILLSTVSKDQGWRSDPNCESSTWFEVGIFRHVDDGTATAVVNNEDVRKHPVTSQPLRWISHLNRVAHNEFETYMGKPFGRDHVLWQHLEPGDRLAVWQCAQYPLWSNSVKELSFQVRGWYEPTLL